MLLLLFETREGRYAMTTEYIVEIVPHVHCKRIPKSQDYVSGIINYRGNPVPVIDLCTLLENAPCESRYSTRIILVDYPLGDGGKKLLGLIAQRVTETVKFKHKGPISSTVVLDDDLYSTVSSSKQEEMIQWFDLKKMIPRKLINELIQD
ncbi:chemotaxis protein CheW [Thermodesulfobacteriota bacterium]